MAMTGKKILLVNILIMASALARADHAMLADGRLLYNVMVPDGATTSGQLIRVRTSNLSFEYDPVNNIVKPLPSYSVTKRLADYVTTSAIVGRREAVAMVYRRNWNNYVPPVRPRLVAPTPAPKATPTPVNYVKTPAPTQNVVSAAIPLQKRLDTQLEIFMKEQGDMARDAVTSVVQGVITPEQSRIIKHSLVQRQKNILQQFYPNDAETVKTAINYWAKQEERVGNTGRFDLEDL